MRCDPRALWGLLLLGTSAWADTTIYLVRHAEKAGAHGDVPLTDAGRARAERLAHMLQDVKLEGVFSTDTIRTRSTGAPAAKARALEVQLYDPLTPEVLVARLEKADGSYLVVGHSNTVPDLVSKLGGDPAGSIADGEYDRLYVVVRPDGAPPVSHLLRYGESTAKTEEVP